MQADEITLLTNITNMKYYKGCKKYVYIIKTSDCMKTKMILRDLNTKS